MKRDLGRTAATALVGRPPSPAPSWRSFFGISFFGISFSTRDSPTSAQIAYVAYPLVRKTGGRPNDVPRCRKNDPRCRKNTLTMDRSGPTFARDLDSQEPGLCPIGKRSRLSSRTLTSAPSSCALRRAATRNGSSRAATRLIIDRDLCRDDHLRRGRAQLPRLARRLANGRKLRATPP